MLFSEENKVPRALVGVRKVAGKQIETVWNCVNLFIQL